MKGILIEKSELLKLIDDLTKNYKVIAPVNKDGLVCLDEVNSESDIVLDLQSKIPSKDILFPRCENLFEYEVTDKDVNLVEPQLGDAKVILFGLPPCEARALTMLDKAFTSGEFQDPYFLNRRRNTIIIGKSCELPRSTCFCTSVGGNPFGKEGLDLILQDLNDKYLLEAVSEEGRKLIDQLRGYRGPSQDDILEVKRIAKTAEESFTIRLDLQRIAQKLEKMFDDPMWDIIYQKCVGCAICSYLCPTCYCFDIVDEDTGAKGKRVRVWDSCQFSLFTLQGSGENPRPTRKERMRQRIMHKFNYYPNEHGEIACVGCGRCICECPVNLDIRQILKMITAE